MEWEDIIELVGLGSIAGLFIYGSMSFSRKIDRIEMLKEACTRQSQRYTTNSKAIVDSYDKEVKAVLAGRFNPISVTHFDRASVYEVMVEDLLYTKKFLNTPTPVISLVWTVSSDKVKKYCGLPRRCGGRAENLRDPGSNECLHQRANDGG